MIIKNSLAREYFFARTSTFGVHYRTGSPGQLGLRVAGFRGHWVAGSQKWVTQFHLWCAESIAGYRRANTASIRPTRRRHARVWRRLRRGRRVCAGRVPDVPGVRAAGAASLAPLPRVRQVRAEARPPLLLHGVVRRPRQSTILRRLHVLRDRQLCARRCAHRPPPHHFRY